MILLGSLEDADSASAPASDPSSPASVDDEKQTAIQLSPVEAFFLAFGLGCLLVECPKASFVEDPELSIDDLWSIFCSYDKGECINFVKLKSNESTLEPKNTGTLINPI